MFTDGDDDDDDDDNDDDDDDGGGYNGGDDQGWDYRIKKLSNADISDFSVYRRVYRIEPKIL